MSIPKPEDSPQIAEEIRQNYHRLVDSVDVRWGEHNHSRDCAAVMSKLSELGGLLEVMLNPNTFSVPDDKVAEFERIGVGVPFCYDGRRIKMSSLQVNVSKEGVRTAVATVVELEKEKRV